MKSLALSLAFYNEVHSNSESKTSMGIKPTTSGLDQPLLCHEARRKRVVRDKDGSCGNENVKGTNECCAAQH